MCDLCKSGDYGASCQDCGKLICFDVKHGDDILRPAYVTASGDLYCDRCGIQVDEDDEYDPEMDFGDFDPYEIDSAVISEG